jgi:hypothetical protein
MTLYVVLRCSGTELTYDERGVYQNGSTDFVVLDPPSVQTCAEIIAADDTTRSVFIYEVATGDLVATVLATEPE